MRLTPKLPSVANPLKLACVMLAVIIAGGCQVNSSVPEPALLKPEPKADVATLMRNFRPTPAYFQSDDVLAGPTEWRYFIRPSASPYAGAVADPASFLVNIAALPVMVFIDYPNQPIHYPGIVYKHAEPSYLATPDPKASDPSYTGVPPIPPTPQGPPELSGSFVY